MKTPKKSSVKAQAFCSKLKGSEVAKSTSWNECLDIINEAFPFCYDIYTKSKKEGDNTIITLYKGDGEKEDQLDQFSFPNDEVFIEKDGDWEWNTIDKFLVEWFIKNWKTLTKGKKPKKKKVATVDKAALMDEVLRLKEQIKTAKGSEKKKLIKEYNEKSVVLDGMLEKAAEQARREQEARKASAEELTALRKRKQALTQRIKEWGARGKDTTELSKELAQVAKELTSATTGVKA
jgi:hypothetical protein